MDIFLNKTLYIIGLKGSVKHSCAKSFIMKQTIKERVFA